MQYRKFDESGWMASALGSGCMRLPTKGGSVEIDQNKTTRLIRYAIDQGVNYIDTAYVYHGEKSEIAVGEALKDGYRQRVKIATKMPPWPVESYAASKDIPVVNKRCSLRVEQTRNDRQDTVFEGR